MNSDNFEIPRYSVVRELGRGTTGVVYEATGGIAGRHVALKIPHDGGSNRFMREARSHACLRHDNIVAIYEVGEHHGQLYLVRELVVGADLEQCLQSRIGNLTGMARVATEISRALEAVHAQGLIHRNLGASNVLISQNGTAKLIGFGRAKARDDDPGIARSQISADITSLGRMIVSAAGQLGEPLPEFLDAVCMKCEKAGSDWGYKSAAELATDLERFQSES
jgi:serine/threonine protein kinase